MKENNHIGSDKVRELLSVPDKITLSDFDVFIEESFSKRTDLEQAILELDALVGRLHNHIQLLSVYLKQAYFTKRNATAKPIEEDQFFTKQEVAVRYRVSARTITNWIVSGLQTTLIGGVIRISKKALDEFVKNNKRRKYNWKSIARKPTKQ